VRRIAEPDAPVLGRIARCVAAPAVDRDVMPARDEAHADFLGAGLEPAVIRRYTARAEDADAQLAGRCSSASRRGHQR